MDSRRFTADLLFGVQLACALLFGLSQMYRMWSSVQGVSASWFLCWALFLAINLRLAYQAHRAQPSRITSQTLWTYAVWSVLITANLVTLLWRGRGTWTEIDDVTVGIALVGIGATLALGRRRGRGWRDPIVRGWFAVFCKGVPQLTLAWNLARVGGAGLAPVGVVAGHVTICTRLAQLVFALGEADWDRHRRGSLISEIANEGTWIVVTIVWLAV